MDVLRKTQDDLLAGKTKLESMSRAVDTETVGLTYSRINIVKLYVGSCFTFLVSQLTNIY